MHQIIPDPDQTLLQISEPSQKSWTPGA